MSDDIKQARDLEQFIDRFKVQQYELTKMSDGTAVMLSIDTGKVVTLSEVATSMVDYIIESHTTKNTSIDDLLLHLLKQYEVEKEKLEEDIVSFLSEISSGI